MHFQFCPICGSKLVLKEAGDDGMVPYCEPCAKMWFDMFSSCIIALVANEYHEIALLRQPSLSDRGVFVSGYIKVKKQELICSHEIESASWVPAEKAPEIMFEDWNGNRAWDIYRTYMSETGTENTVA